MRRACGITEYRQVHEVIRTGAHIPKREYVRLIFPTGFLNAGQKMPDGATTFCRQAAVPLGREDTIFRHVPAA